MAPNPNPTSNAALPIINDMTGWALLIVFTQCLLFSAMHNPIIAVISPLDQSIFRTQNAVKKIDRILSSEEVTRHYPAHEKVNALA